MRIVSIEQMDQAPVDVWGLAYAVEPAIAAGWNPKTAAKQRDQRPDEVVGIEYGAASANAACRNPTTATK